jgi:excisionase family DNA binding protein
MQSSPSKDKAFEALLAQLSRLPQAASDLQEQELSMLLANLTAVQSALLVRLLALRAPRAAAIEDQLLTVREVAEQLRLRPAYVYDLVRRGDLEAVRAGKYVRVAQSAVSSWRRRHSDRDHI